MEGFPPEHLDMDRLIENLADAKVRAGQYRAIYADLPAGDEKQGWGVEAARAESEIEVLVKLIGEKKEFDRG